MSYYSTQKKICNKDSEVYYAMFFSNPSEKILDIGCSIGNFLVHCNKDSYGIDIDQDQLKIAKERGLNVKRCNINNEKLPFKNNTFDAVNCHHLIEHITNPVHLFEEMKRVLKVKGKIILETPNLKSWKLKFWNEPTHTQPHTKEALKRLCSGTGFKNFKIKYIKCGMFGAGKMFKFGISPEIIKKIMFFYGLLHRKNLLLEVKNE